METSKINFFWRDTHDSKAFNVKQFSIRPLLFTFLVPVAILCVMAVVHLFFGYNITRMTRDIAVIAEINPLTGFLSNFGAFLWCSAAAVCVLACTTLHSLKKNDMFWFFFFSALLSSYLLFDDFFMFHEELGPRYLGLNEKLIIALLGLATLVYLIYFGRIILFRTNWFFFFLALGFLSTSVAIDTFFYRWLAARIGFNWAFFLEDGTKWLGIVSWFSYYLQASHQALSNIRCNCCGEAVQSSTA